MQVKRARLTPFNDDGSGLKGVVVGIVSREEAGGTLPYNTAGFPGADHLPLPSLTDVADLFQSSLTTGALRERCLLHP